MFKKSLRRERFENVAAKRTQKVLEYLNKLANCSNKNNYEYNDSDVRKMFKEIKELVNHTETLFKNEMKRSNKNTFTF